METQIIQFLVSYDLLTSNIRLIEEQMIDKTKGRAVKAVNLGQGEIKQQNNLSQGPIKELVILNPEKLN